VRAPAPPLSLRRIARFALLAGFIYAGFVAAWPWIGGGYASAFRWGVGRLFDGLAGLSITLSPASSENAPDDTELQVQNPRRWARFTLSSRRQGFFPASLWFAITLATPMPMRRKLLVLALGLVLLHVLLAGQFAAVLANRLTELRFLAPPGWLAASLRMFVSDALFGINFTLAPFLTWALLVLPFAAWREGPRTIRAAAQDPDHAIAGPR
jgi:hypothetical protein